MFSKLRSIAMTLVAAGLAMGLASCGGGGNTILDPDGGGPGVEISTITVLAASTTLTSDQSGAGTVGISAQVKDVNNNILADIPVTFSATSGSLAVTQNVTDSAGLALASLSNGTNPAERAITVTASAGGRSGSVVVNVVGTQVSVTGPTGLALNDSANYVISVKDGLGVGVANVTATVTSALGNTITAPTLTTDSAGTVSFTLTAGSSGTDTLTISALGDTVTHTVVVSGDSFVFESPPANSEVGLNTDQSVTVRWLQNGSPVNGQTITFTSTRGTITSSVVTGADGRATTTARSASAGPATITAVAPALNGSPATSTSLGVEFIASTPASIELQASPLTVGAGEQTELTALVRDVNNNLVKNQTIEFIIDSDITGGSLSVGTDITDSQGRAQSVYTGGSVPSAADGVILKAVVQGTGIEDEVRVTVARQELFITLGTGNTLFEIGTATYAKEWVILVTDVDGNAVANKPVQASVRSRRYFEGYLQYYDDPGVWDYANVQPPAVCQDEDVNQNGILDPGEAINNNNKIEAGNIVLVAAVPPGAPANDPCSDEDVSTGTAANVVTNAQGRARVCIYYPQNYAHWLEANITAKSSVTGGTEFSESTVFLLDVLSDDVTDEDVDPPNLRSPFGTDYDCTTAVENEP